MRRFALSVLRPRAGRVLLRRLSTATPERVESIQKFTSKTDKIEKYLVEDAKTFGGSVLEVCTGGSVDDHGKVRSESCIAPLCDMFTGFAAMSDRR